MTEVHRLPCVPQDFRELVALPDGATGRTVQSRFDAEVVEVRALPAWGITKTCQQPTRISLGDHNDC